MNNEPELTPHLTEIFDVLSTSSLNHIYSKLSIDADVNFEIEDQTNFILDVIETLFDAKFRLIPSQELQENIELINNTFVKLIKYCFDHNFKKPGIIFISYCDFFDLDIHVTYLGLHNKLQTLITFNTKVLVGKKCFDKYQRKSDLASPNNGLKIPTLFDLVKNKQKNLSHV
jgi:hypothetical protein